MADPPLVCLAWPGEAGSVSWPWLGWAAITPVETLQNGPNDVPRGWTWGLPSISPHPGHPRGARTARYTPPRGQQPVVVPGAGGHSAACGPKRGQKGGLEHDVPRGWTWGLPRPVPPHPGRPRRPCATRCTPPRRQQPVVVPGAGGHSAAGGAIGWQKGGLEHDVPRSWTFYLPRPIPPHSGRPRSPRAARCCSAPLTLPPFLPINPHSLSPPPIFIPLLPLDGGGRLGGAVVRAALDALHLVDDARRDPVFVFTFMCLTSPGPSSTPPPLWPRPARKDSAEKSEP